MILVIQKSFCTWTNMTRTTDSVFSERKAYPYEYEG